MNAYELHELEEATGILQKVKFDDNNILLRISYRWYSLPKERSIVKALRKLSAGQRVAVLNIDGDYRVRRLK